MPRLMVEIKEAGDRPLSIDEVIGELEMAGAEPVKGYDPVPMGGGAGEPESFIVTVDVADPRAVERIEALPWVVQIFGDAKIGPMAP